MLWLLVAALAVQTQDEVRVSSHAYVPQSPYTLRVDTKLVEIAATVRDSHGKAISGLTKDDFQVLDNGQVRAIEAFEVDKAQGPTLNMDKPAAATEPPQSGAPVSTSARPTRFLALFIDDVNGKDEAMAGDLKRTQVAAERFIEDALQTNVRIGIFTASGAQSLAFTTDKSKLIESITALKAHVRMREGGIVYCPRVTPYLAMLIASDRDRGAMRAVLMDADQKNCPTTAGQVRAQAEETWQKVKEISIDTLDALANAVERLANEPGKRELIVASSGFLTVTLQDQKDKVVNRALHAGVVISSLDSKGLYSEGPPGSRPQDAAGYKGGFPTEWFQFETIALPLRLQTLNEPMANLAEATGGVFYHNNNDLLAGFRELGNPPEVTYRISFRPDGVTPDGSYHKLKIIIIHAKGNYSLQARPGYFAPSEKAKTETLQGKIDREILAVDTVTGFPVGIAVRRGNGTLSVVVKVDISKLRFAKQGDRQMQRIAFTTALIDADGKIVAAKEGLMELALTEATYKRLSSTGVSAVLTLPASPGVYKLREVAEEAVDGKLACSTHSIEIK
jgi:VWFA-related protein